jgi:amino acid permease
MQALAEMCVVYPVKGSFCAFSTRFISPAWGFAMGWNYAMQVCKKLMCVTVYRIKRIYMTDDVYNKTHIYDYVYNFDPYEEGILSRCCSFSSVFLTV